MLNTQRFLWEWLHRFYYAISPLLKILNEIVPKDDKIIIFRSIPDFSDNPWYLYRKMLEIPCLSEKQYVWLVENDNMARSFNKKEYQNTFIVRYFSLDGLKYLFKAKYIVTSHKVPIFKSRKQIAIVLWHGIPIKAMGKYKKRRDANERICSIIINFNKILTNYFLISSSTFTSKLFNKLFDVPLSHILPFGFPRNDILLRLNSKYINYIKTLLNINFEEKVLLYLPTFRSSKGVIKIIDNLIKNTNLENFLENNKFKLLIKIHPFDEWYFKNIKNINSNILILTNKYLKERNIELYSLLSMSNLLITDYSSVFFDYLFLNRPIIFFVPDLDVYKKERGFCLTPYEKWTPGDKVKTIEELIYAIEKNLNNPELWERERLRIRDIMFEYVDENSSDRIINYFWCNSEKE